LPGGEVTIGGRRAVVLENAAARLVVDVLGGAFVDFHFHDQQLNPLVWNNEGDPHEPRQMSHFLCVDRWGWPSEREAQHGMPYHGEAGLVEWHLLERSDAPPPARTRTHMRAHLPIANLDVRRSIVLAATEAVFTVTEAVTNLNRLGTVLNMVQHPSIGPPFLDENTVVDANAAEGFVLANPKPHPERRTSRWPQAHDRAGHAVDMRHLTSDHDPNVVAYVIDEEVGWATAANPQRGLLIGYVWKTADYPWFNVWRRAEKGRPLARGLEFGTTGLDWPPGELLRKAQIFGRPLFVHLDAGETLTKSFTCFLLRIPSDYRGVAALRQDADTLIVHERGTPRARELRIESVPAAVIPRES
jgi:hypothetical protein